MCLWALQNEIGIQMRTTLQDDGKKLVVWAPAKVNLFFEIHHLRRDGYHDIETLVAPVSLFDRIEFAECDSLCGGTRNFVVECCDENGSSYTRIPSDSSNLIFRAYEVFCKASAEKQELSPKLRSLSARVYKGVPIQAGLGGGSSDAAATLVALNLLTNDIFSANELKQMAAQLGSDVPLFLESGASIGRGRGELVEPFRLPSLNLVILKPRDGVPTPAAYRAFDSMPPCEPRSLESLCRAIRNEYETNDQYDSRELSSRVARVLARGISNRLEEAVASIWRDARRWRDMLASTPNALVAQMTGSGSAFFAIYPDEESATLGAECLRERSQPVRDELEGIYVVKTLTS